MRFITGKYVENNLGKNETIVKKADRNGLFLLATWIKGILLCRLLLIPVFKAIIATIRFTHIELAITNKLVIGKVVVSIPIVILVIVWFFLCLTMTYRHFRYHLAITDSRVIGKAGAEELNSPLDELVNVFIERSFWGKLLNYGAVTVQTKKKTLTFYNIESPKAFYDKIMSYAENYCAH